ncbi:LytTR family transcriptional regulator DNA-binding domain-containing protein [Spirosoma panaciterrae]|uniref:LytR/AlgR family response regulator transcription factor n=1 Tax=Spirosoma panaciterrae TaxID=496058 RepID=UPI0003813129
MKNSLPPDPPNKGLIPAYRHIQDLFGLIYLEGRGNYTLVYLQNSLNPLLVSKTLKYFEQQLPDFVRISKSVLINPRFISRVSRQGSKLLSIELGADISFSVARRRIDLVLQRLAETS